MSYTESGVLQDQNGPDPDSPAGQFASDFTKNYDRIGKIFPEFLRLKELTKVQFLKHPVHNARLFVKELRDSNSDLTQKFFREFLKINPHISPRSGLSDYYNLYLNSKENQLRCLEDKFEMLKKFHCDRPKSNAKHKWVPAVLHSSHNKLFYGGVTLLKYGGVTLCPKVKPLPALRRSPALSYVTFNGFEREKFRPMAFQPKKHTKMTAASATGEI
jgi:hypothetical protein